MNTENLATEILHEFKIQSKRYFIMLIVAVLLLFASNTIWAYMWYKDKTVTERHTVSGQDNANVLYNREGDMNIDGMYKDKNK